MPRFWDIFVLLNCLTLGIMLVNGMFMFSVNYATTPNTTDSYDQSAIRTSINQSSTSSQLDAFTASVGFFGLMIGFILNFAGQTLGMYDTMTTVFHVPLIVVQWLSGLLGLMWLAFFIQLISRMGWGLVKD
jgi:hypothetical protein